MKRILISIIIFSIILPCLAAAEAVLPAVNITAESLTDWAGKSDVRAAVLEYNDPVTGLAFTQNITIKIQGTSSLGYPKKNFTIEFLDSAVEMQPGWGAQTKYCLKADYIDPTRCVNVVSAKLVGQMQAATGKYEGLPNRGAIDGFPVWITLNGEDAGIYNWNIPKDGWMFAMDKNNPDHIVLCSDTFDIL